MPVTNAREWRTGQELAVGPAINVQIPPGETRFVEVEVEVGGQ
jgi:hypothetical protein